MENPSMDPWMRTGCTQILGNPFGPLTVEPVEARMMSWVSPSTGWPKLFSTGLEFCGNEQTPFQSAKKNTPELRSVQNWNPERPMFQKHHLFQVPDPSIWRKAWEICLWKMVISCGEVWWSHVKFAIDTSHIYHTKLYSYLLGGFNLPLWKMMEFVSWDDDIPNIWKDKSHVPNHQSVIHHYTSQFQHASG